MQIWKNTCACRLKRCIDDNWLKLQTDYTRVATSIQKSLINQVVSNYGVMQCGIVGWHTFNNYSCTGIQLT